MGFEAKKEVLNELPIGAVSINWVARLREHT